VTDTGVPVPDYIAVRDAQHRYLRTVPGVRAVLAYEPRAVQAGPLIYTLLDEVPLGVTGQVEDRTYGMIHRLCVPWQDSEGAEDEIARLVDPIIDALRRAFWTRLDGLIASGTLKLGTVRAGFLTIGGALYRVVDFPTSALVKGPHTRHQP
jgi:hypothetical protein